MMALALASVTISASVMIALCKRWMRLAIILLVAHFVVLMWVGWYVPAAIVVVTIVACMRIISYRTRP